MYLTAGVVYEMEVGWVEYTGGAIIQLSWQYPGQAKTPIPSNVYKGDPQYVASSPYLVPVTCPTGYGDDTLSNPGE